MAGRINIIKTVKIIHRYSAFIITGSLLMYICTGFLMTRHGLWSNTEEKAKRSELTITIPAGMTDEELPRFIRQSYGLNGRSGKPQKNKSGEITILYSKPGIRHQAVVSSGRKSLTITTVRTGVRATITAFHRLKNYGDGLIYNLYVIMTDITGAGILIFSLTGLIIAFSNPRNLIIKIFLFIIGIAYSLLVIVSFMKG